MERTIMSQIKVGDEVRCLKYCGECEFRRGDIIIIGDRQMAFHRPYNIFFEKVENKKKVKKAVTGWVVKDKNSPNYFNTFFSTKEEALKMWREDTCDFIPVSGEYEVEEESD